MSTTRKEKLMLTITSDTLKEVACDMCIMAAGLIAGYLVRMIIILAI